MKRKHVLFLIFEVLGLCVLCCCMKEFGQAFSGFLSFGGEIPTASETESTFGPQGNLLIFALSFPFSQIGFLLNRLSALGKIGNGFALSFIVLSGAIPLIAFLKNCKKINRKKENLILFLLWPLCTFVIYAMAKPQVIYGMIPTVTEDFYIIMKAVLGGAVWSGIACLIVLKILGNFRTSDRKKILSYAKKLLFALCVLFAAAIGYIEFNELLTKLTEDAGSTDRFIALCCFIVSALPYLLDIVIIFSGCKLIDAVEVDKGTDEIGFYANKLSDLCIGSLSAVMMLSFIYNLMQVIFASNLTNIRVSVEIPLLSLAFTMAVLLLSRLVIKNKQLKEDNELFI